MLKILLIFSSLIFAHDRVGKIDYLLVENEIRTFQIASILQAKLTQANSFDHERTGLADGDAIRLTLRLCAEAVAEAELQMRGLEVSKITASDINFLIQIIRPSLQDLDYPELYFKQRREEINQDLEKFDEVLSRLRNRIKDQALTLEELLTHAIDHGVDLPDSLMFQAKEIAVEQKRIESLRTEISDLEKKQKAVKASLLFVLRQAEQFTPQVFVEKVLNQSHALMSSGQTSAQIQIAADFDATPALRKDIEKYNFKLQRLFVDQVTALKKAWLSLLIEKGLNDYVSINFNFILNEAHLTAYGMRAHFTVTKTIKLRGQIFEESENLNQFSISIPGFEDYLKSQLPKLIATGVKNYDPKIVSERLSQMIRSSVCESFLNEHP